jgi:hypothetical protein
MTAPRRSFKDTRLLSRWPRRRRPAAAAAAGSPRRFRPRFERVEDRALLATFLVTTTADDGPGSLRQAILDSNAATGGTNTIDFAIPDKGIQRIATLSALPAIAQAVLIDGESQAGYAGTPLIEIDGQDSGLGDGLTITGSGTTVRGLAIDDFPSGAGVVIDGAVTDGAWASGNTVAADVIGTDPTGRQVRPTQTGVEIEGGAHDNTVGGLAAGAANLIRTLGSGVVVTGDGSVGNAILGNSISAVAAGLTFDGSGSYVQVPSFSLGGPLTVEAWVKSDGCDYTVVSRFYSTNSIHATT